MNNRKFWLLMAVAALICTAAVTCIKPQHMPASSPVIEMPDTSFKPILNHSEIPNKYETID